MRQEPATTEKNHPEQQRRRVRVLVVDDYVDNAESMALLLRLCGHDVETALAGPAALRAAQALQPDAVLLDISMPGMSGYEVARRLRSMFQNRVLLIAITARRFEEDRTRGREAGVDRPFLKPAYPPQLHTLLRPLTAPLPSHHDPVPHHY